MSKIVLVNDDNFQTEVMESDVPVFVDFSAVWCGPCQRQLPVLEQFATDNTGKVKICKVDVDESPGLSAKFGIRGVPSIILFNKGAQLDMKTGLTTSSALENILLENIAVK